MVERRRRMCRLGLEDLDRECQVSHIELMVAMGLDLSVLRS